jgi:hypothetical protein
VTQHLLLEYDWGADFLGESHLPQVNVNRKQKPQLSRLARTAAHSPRYVSSSAYACSLNAYMCCELSVRRLPIPVIRL